MARYTPTGTVTSVPAINAELEKISEAIEDCLSREGDTPNQMEDVLDMNGYSILNAVTDVNKLGSLATVEYVLSQTNTNPVEKVELTTNQLISSTLNQESGTLVRTSGFYGNGDGGDGLWRASSTTGLTPSQTPILRGYPEFTDATGRLWQWAGLELPLEAIGALGNNEFDNLPVFDAATAWSTATRRKCTLGGGVFLTSESITVDGGYLRIQGASRSDTLIRQAASGNGDVIGVLGDGWLVLESLTIDHNSTGNGKTAGHGVRSGGHKLLIIRDVKIFDCLGYGIAHQQGTARSTYIVDFEIDGAGNDGIDIKDRNFDNECVFISNGFITNWSRGDSDDAGIDVRGEVLATNIKLLATSSCVGVRFRLGTPSAGRSGFGHYSNIIFDGQDIQGTVAIGHESDDRGATYSNITVKDAIYPWVQYVGSVGGTINNITATGTVVSNFAGTDLIINGCSIENVEAASRMFDYAASASRNRITNVNLKNNASTGELARHVFGAKGNQIVGGYTNTIAVNDTGATWVLDVTQVTY